MAARVAELHLFSRRELPYIAALYDILAGGYPRIFPSVVSYNLNSPSRSRRTQAPDNFPRVHVSRESARIIRDGETERTVQTGSATRRESRSFRKLMYVFSLEWKRNRRGRTLLCAVNEHSRAMRRDQAEWDCWREAERAGLSGREETGAARNGKKETEAPPISCPAG